MHVGGRLCATKENLDKATTPYICDRNKIWRSSAPREKDTRGNRDRRLAGTTQQISRHQEPPLSSLMT